MAKLKEAPVELGDLNEYLASESDFAFELKVLEVLRGLDFTCQHGGTYEDPQTKKLRQFDLRASIRLDYAILRLAVECKQIGENFPLLVLRVPRQKEESFHDLLLTVDRKKVNIHGSIATQRMETRGSTIRVPHALYGPSDHVGRSCAQVGRDDKGTITATDSEVFAKWSQAISSAHGVMHDALYGVPAQDDGWCLSLVLPVVVVPDGRLWAADYDNEGRVVCEPRQVERCSYSIGAAWNVGDPQVSAQYTLSHLEFVTFSGLREFVRQFGIAGGGPNSLAFPKYEASRLIQNKQHAPSQQIGRKME